MGVDDCCSSGSAGRDSRVHAQLYLNACVRSALVLGVHSMCARPVTTHLVLCGSHLSVCIWAELAVSSWRSHVPTTACS